MAYPYGMMNRMAPFPEKIISGGQTGADRAALDAAISAGVGVGGWVPRGRLAEDGAIPASYPNLKETGTDDPRERTRCNVADSDGTVVVLHGPAEGGTAYTISIAMELRKLLLVLDMDALDARQAAAILKEWIGKHSIRVLNVAGPRASKDGRIYGQTYRIISEMLTGHGE